jgi:tRNA pseudouridine32 synthase/23S rRNA pseudouridine746 synthase/23S rRNA pseudouridine1911/1915/1917 synthase
MTTPKQPGAAGKAREPAEQTKSKRRVRPLALGLTILYEDRDVLLVDKPAGVLSMASERERERTAYFVMMDYVRKGNPKSHNRVFIVHRLDRETSGVLLLAKSEDAKRKLQENWEDADKRYLAVVRGRVKQDKGTIESYLAENVAHMVYCTDDHTRGKLARTDYRVIKRTESRTLVQVRLLTGRKNQIRVHFADQGHAIIGDRKYGDKKDPVRQLALHALAIEFPHPHSGELVRCTAPVPRLFENLVGPFSGEL